MGDVTKVRKISKSGLSLLAVLLVSTWLTGCATTVETQQKISATNQDAANLRRISLVGFEGKYASEVNAAFETALVGHQFDNQPYFVVADRVRTKEAMREFKSSLSGAVDPSMAVRFGKRVGVNGIYFGDITVANLSSQNIQRNDKYCKRHKDNDSNKKCKEWGSRKINCRERTAMLTLVPRLIHVETGQVVYRAEHSGEERSTSCPGYASKPDHVLLAAAIDSAIAKILTDIAPSTRTVKVEILAKPSSLTGPGADMFQNGVEFSEAGRMDRACGIWKGLDQRIQSSDNALLYNVAVCEELEGHYEKALGLYMQVDSRLMKPDPNVSKGIDRVKSTLAASR